MTLGQWLLALGLASLMGLLLTAGIGVWILFG